MALSHPQYLYLGPEVYHMKRTKKGGSKQTGWLYGGRAVYERRPSKGIYWAADAYYAHGRLDGKTPSGRTLKSKITDSQIEGRLGYSFCIPSWHNLTLTPYGGYGYLYSKNDFIDPSPLPLAYHNRIYYGAAGMAASLCVIGKLEVGCDFKAKFMTEGKVRIKDDPDYDDVELLMENETHYEVDVPFKYATCCKGWLVTAVAEPFYRFRHYGGRMNYPYDFIETKFRIYGIRFLLDLTF